MDSLRQVILDCASRPPDAVDPAIYGFLGAARGIVHVGAHVGQERDVYGDLPVAWIEAAPVVFEVLCDRIAGYPRQRAFHYLVGDGRRHRFGLSSNACASSSIFDFSRHKELWPDVGYLSAIDVESVALADIVRRHELEDYDALVLDVQGSELMVLQGANLDQFQWIVAEAADFEAYVGGCQLHDLDEYLKPRGFR